MSLPSSPASSTGSDDFAALLDATLSSTTSEAESSEEIIEPPRKRKHIDNDLDNTNTSVYSNIDTTASESATVIEEVADADHSLVGQKVCPPHPGFMWDVCIRCGALKPPNKPDEQGVALRYIHEGLEVSHVEAERIRSNELAKVLSKKKLYLVLDLDHTLLNSAKLAEIPLVEVDYLSRIHAVSGTHLSSESAATGAEVSLAQSKEHDGNRNFNLYNLGNLHMYTKLRPFVHEFLEKASNLFEMYLYTMGERIYAQAMAQLLDPAGRFFGSRVISQSDSTCRTTKDLDIMLGAESAVIILDDTEGVWPKHKANLVLMERYHFFSSSCKQFGIQNASLLEAMKDESKNDGTLANTLELLQSVHSAFFHESDKDSELKTQKVAQGGKDVRKILQNIRSKVLAGCKVVFSRIFPTGLPSPETHPFWRLTEELGAVCTNSLDASVTHVVALDKGTDKSKWAVQHNRHLVHPRWVEAALYTWRRPVEENFTVDDAQLLSTFSRTIDLPHMEEENEDSTNKDGKEVL